MKNVDFITPCAPGHRTVLLKDEELARDLM